MDEIINRLERQAKQIRKNIVSMVGYGKPGHFGGSCSIADFVAVLYFYKMKHDSNNPDWEERDRFILSKGHAAIVQYAALAMCGYFPIEELYELKKLGSRLQGHPDMRKTIGIDANTGSLGQGISVACGIAAGAKLDRKSYRVYCVVGDGEIAEGQVWEAAMSASFYKLDNLTVVLDCNKLQATGSITERFNTNPHREKWLAFGWNVLETDGHDIEQIIHSLNKAERVVDKPTIIIAHTIKGKGISFAENNVAFHNGTMTQEEFEEALNSLIN